MSNIFHFIMSHFGIIFPVVVMAIWGGMQVRKAGKVQRGVGHVARRHASENDDDCKRNTDNDTNMDGSIMMGCIDIHGNPYGSSFMD